MLPHRISILLLFLLLPVQLKAESEKPFLHEDPMFAFWGSGCHPGVPNILAGASFIVNTFCSRDTTSVIEVGAWPVGYAFSLLVSEAIDTAWQTVRLDQNEWKALSIVQQHEIADSHNQMMLSGFVTLTSPMNKTFCFTVPDKFADKKIRFQVEYIRDEVVQVSEARETICIVRPCNSNDSVSIVASRMWALNVSRDYASTIHMADSLVEVGQSNPVAWAQAMSAATHLGLIEKEIEFFTRLWHEYGVTHVLGGARELPVYNPGISSSAREKQAFEKRLQRLLQMKSEASTSVR